MQKTFMTGKHQVFGHMDEIGDVTGEKKEETGAEENAHKAQAVANLWLKDSPGSSTPLSLV